MKLSRKVALSVIMIISIFTFSISPGFAAYQNFISSFDGYDYIHHNFIDSTYGQTDVWYGTTASLQAYAVVYVWDPVLQSSVWNNNDSNALTGIYCEARAFKGGFLQMDYVYGKITIIHDGNTKVHIMYTDY